MFPKAAATSQHRRSGVIPRGCVVLQCVCRGAARVSPAPPSRPWSRSRVLGFTGGGAPHPASSEGPPAWLGDGVWRRGRVNSDGTTKLPSAPRPRAGPAAQEVVLCRPWTAAPQDGRGRARALGGRAGSGHLRGPGRQFVLGKPLGFCLERPSEFSFSLRRVFSSRRGTGAPGTAPAHTAPPPAPRPTAHPLPGVLSPPPGISARYKTAFHCISTVIGELRAGVRGCFLKVAAARTACCSSLVTHVAGTRPHAAWTVGAEPREGGDVSVSFDEERDSAVSCRRAEDTRCCHNVLVSVTCRVSGRAGAARPPKCTLITLVTPTHISRPRTLGCSPPVSSSRRC